MVVKKEHADSGGKYGAWLMKRSKYEFCFKKDHFRDNQGLVLGVFITTSRNEIASLQGVLDRISINAPKKIPLKAHKRYQSNKNAELLK